jgi:hexokinase
MYPEDMPEDGPDVYWTTLISFIEQDQNEDLPRFREALCRRMKIDATAISYDDLRTLREVSRSVSRRAARLAAAAILGYIRDRDPRVSSNYLIAVDGAVYARHPKMHVYIDGAVAELRKQLSGDGGGRVEFAIVRDAVGVGAAVAAANSCARGHIL